MRKIKIEHILIPILILLTYAFISVVFGRENYTFGIDFDKQHIYFIDYIRNNLYYSHDLFPQLDMNHGLTQSMASLYYHGLYNPYIIVGILCPFLTARHVVLVIILIIIALTMFFADMLFTDYGINRKNRIIALSLVGTLPVIGYNSSMHLMYIYYIPFLFSSLAAINRFDRKSGKLLYIFSFVGIAYTNFFMLPPTFIISFLYWWVAIKKKKIAINKKMIIDFIIINVIFLMLSMFYLLPQFFLFLGGSRSDFSVDFYNMKNIFQLSFETKYIQSFLSPPMYLMFVYITYWLIKKKDIFIVFIVFFLLERNIYILNKALNVFQYGSDKIEICLIAVFFLIFAYFLQNSSKKELKNSIIIAATAIIVYFFVHYVFGDTAIKVMYLINLFAIIIIYIILLMKEKLKTKYIFVSMSFVCTFAFVIANMTFMDEDKIDESYGTFTYTGEFENYRDYTVRNYNFDLSSFGTSIYTSMENGYYYELMNGDLLEQENNDRSRIITNNLYTDYVLGIKNNKITTRPMIYATTNENIYSEELLVSKSIAEKLISQLTGVYTDNNLSNQEHLISADKEVSKDTLDVLAGEYSYQNAFAEGIVILNFEFDKEMCKSNCPITINDSYNEMYKGELNSNYTFILDSVPVFDIKIKEDMTLDNINITYVSIENIKENVYDYIMPTNFEVDLNDKFEFDIKMPSDGYLVTTIPFDEGYTIYVDGQIVDTQVANNYFFSAKISSGEHHIEIVYHIKGFTVGAVITVLGIIATIGYLKYDNRKIKK